MQLFIKKALRVNNEGMQITSSQKILTLKNNLSGWGMINYLPYNKFKWVKDVDKFDFISVSEKKFYRIHFRY